MPIFMPKILSLLLPVIFGVLRLLLKLQNSAKETFRRPCSNALLGSETFIRWWARLVNTRQSEAASIGLRQHRSVNFAWWFSFLPVGITRSFVAASEMTSTAFSKWIKNSSRIPLGSILCLRKFISVQRSGEGGWSDTVVAYCFVCACLLKKRIMNALDLYAEKEMTQAE